MTESWTGEERDVGGRYLRHLPEGEDPNLFQDVLSLGKDFGKLPVTDWEYVSSSRVKAVRYDPNERKLCVRFIKLGDRLGLAYVYDEVPQHVFEQFLVSGSLGRYINSVLNNFSYHPADEAELQKYFSGERYN